ncbi:MAG: hypothetical protein V4547_17830 [Bacteroidota bacterium]
MSPKQKNIAIFSFIAVAAIGGLIFYSKRKEKQGDSLLDFLNGSISQVDLNQASNQNIQNIQAMQPDPNKIAIGSLKGKVADPAVNKALVRLVTELQISMRTPMSSVTPTLKLLSQVKNKSTLSFIDKMFKAQYGKGLFDTMKEKTLFNNTAYQQYSDKTKGNFTIPGLSDSHWLPALADWLNKLPLY